jgi:hypothetical protein
LVDYILPVDHPDVDGDFQTGKYNRWAKRAVRRMNRKLECEISARNTDSPFTLKARIVRQASKGSTKKKASNLKASHRSAGRNDRMPELKYGVRVPRSVKEAFELDQENGNNFMAGGGD